MVDDGVPPDFVGSQVRRLTYTFTCQFRSGAVVLGSGLWTGRSRQDHPDFAWYPYLARAQNPEVKYTAVQELIGQSQPAPPPARPDPQPTRPAQPSRPEVTSRPRPLPGPDDAAQRVVLTPVELAALVANRTFGLRAGRHRRPVRWWHVPDGGADLGPCPRPRGGLTSTCSTLDNRGKLSLLYPPMGHPTRIVAETTTDIRGANDDFLFTASKLPGLHRIKAVVTSRPIFLGGLVGGQQQQQQQQQTQQGKPSVAKAKIGTAASRGG